jgi:hypothetical protein
MTGVTTRHPEEPYANSARTVLWEVLGASRAPTLSGNIAIAREPCKGRRKIIGVLRPLQGSIGRLIPPGVRKKRSPLANIHRPFGTRKRYKFRNSDFTEAASSLRARIDLLDQVFEYDSVKR